MYTVHIWSVGGGSYRGIVIKSRRRCKNAHVHNYNIDTICRDTPQSGAEGLRTF